MTPLDLLKPLLTPDVIALAHERLTTRKNLFRGQALEVPGGKVAAKLALIAVRAMNPLETLSAEEEALLRGVSRKTLNR